jgi:hypothetical protein
MTHRIRRAAILTAAASLISVSAFAAADPTPDSRYAGSTSQAGGLRFEFRTSADGSKAERILTQFRAPRCERARNGAQGSIRVRSVRIADGAFAARGSEKAALPASDSFGGGTQIERYSIRGHFKSGERAKGTLSVRVTVKDKAGAVIDRCTMGKRTARWRADRLGVVPDTIG